MRRLELASISDCSIGQAWRFDCAPIEGDLGPIWISAGGGGLGSRGELGAIDMLREQGIREAMLASEREEDKFRLSREDGGSVVCFDRW